MEPNHTKSSDTYAADISSIREAQVRIKPFAQQTPVLTSDTLDSIAGRKLYFKCECFQKGGAFKFRGACNAIFSLDDDQATKGVVTHSSGNHAAALSLAAKLRGIPAYIVIPKDAPKCKVANVKRYGGQVIFSEPSMQSREDTANKVLQDTGAVLVPSSNDRRIISGQGTISLEFLEQASDIDTLIVPISGGGMISGVALAAKAINPAIRILAAEPLGANDAFQSKSNGRITKLSEVNTIADGLRAFLGDLTWPIVRDLVDDVIVVDDMEPNHTKSSDCYAADISSIRAAQVRIKPFAQQTPVLTSDTLDSIAGRKLYFKCECFQKGGAFKFRGACNAIFSLDDDQATKGVVTHSSGNHAAALSLAANLRGIPAYIVVPKDAPKCKVANVKRYGGHVIFSEPSMQSREDTANKVLQDTGAVLVPSSNDGRIISGQGTISLEFLEQASEIDTLIVPISGGGMISGVALAAKAINPAIRILAAEPLGANDAFQSKSNGKITKLSEVNTIADGLRAFLGNLTWPIVRDLVDDVIVVDDKEIIQAMKLCYEILKIAVEPSGAIGLAAVLSDGFRKNPVYSECNHIGIVLSGGNVDLGVLWNSFDK
uniref:Serine racemase n=1 Tax=Solanum lycopersicum TaxID=4081 RepID=A0A3Q7HL05_SOLLC